MLKKMMVRLPVDQLAETFGLSVEEMQLEVDALANTAQIKPHAVVMVKRKRSLNKRHQNARGATAIIKLITKDAKSGTITSDKAASMQKRKEQLARQTKKTLVVDYTALQLVRIDAKTCVYTKPGESPAECRARYSSIHKKAI